MGAIFWKAQRTKGWSDDDWRSRGWGQTDQVLPTVEGTGGESHALSLQPEHTATWQGGGRGGHLADTVPQRAAGTDGDLRPSQVRAFTCMISSKHYTDEDTVT